MSTVQLIGENISYSASPAMHAAAFEALSLGHTYELADVSAEELQVAVAALRSTDFLGANVTVPHKAAVIDHLDEVDQLAAEAGAVNTIVVRRGRLIGSNTDVPAIAEQLRKLRAAPRVALVLGAGGAARAVRLALESLGSVEIVTLSRSSWSDLPRLLEGADLLVNATPIGTDSNETPVDQRLLHSGLAVLDLVYRPSPTRLVADARECGLDARSGAGVLLGQGWRSLEAWLGRPVGGSVKGAMAAALRHELRQEADV
jgi:shikimate dehydrogenase